MSRADGKTSEGIASFLYEEVLSPSESSGIRSLIGLSAIGDTLATAASQSAARAALNLNGGVVLTRYNDASGAAGGSNLSSGFTLFQDLASSAGRISKFWAEFGTAYTYPATIKMLIGRLTPTNQITVIASYTLTVPASGVVNWTDADFGTVNIDAGDYVGFFGPSSGGAAPRYDGSTTYARYLYTGDAGLIIRTYTRTASSYQLKYGWTVESVSSVTDPAVTSAITALQAADVSLDARTDVLELKGSGNTILSESFLRDTSSGWTKTAGWTDSSGLLTPSGAGDFSQRAYLTGKIFHAERRSLLVDFVPQATGIRIACGYCGLAAVEVNGTCLAGVDDVSHLLTIYQVGTLGTEASVSVSAALPALVAGREYRLEFIRDRRINTVGLRDMVTGAITATVSQGTNSDASTNTVTGDLNGAPLLVNKTGQTLFRRVRVSTPYTRPIMIIGDSRTTGFGLALADRWSQKVSDAVGGNVVISAVSGMKSDTLGFKLAGEIPALAPPLIIVDLGTNDQDANLSALQTEFGALRTWCAANNSKCVFAIIPPNGRDVDSINAWILGLTDQTVIRQDLALSLNNDGSTQVAANYQGGTGVHESAAGNTIMAARAVIDCPDLQR